MALKSLQLDNGGVPSDDEIIAGLAAHFEAPEAAVIAWLARIKLQFDPKAAAERLAEREGAKR